MVYPRQITNTGLPHSQEIRKSQEKLKKKKKVRKKWGFLKKSQEKSRNLTELKIKG